MVSVNKNKTCGFFTSATCNIFVFALLFTACFDLLAGVGSSSVSDLLPEKLEAILIPDQGYHQVGPADLCTDMFVLSVTVAFATKLEQVKTEL